MTVVAASPAPFHALAAMLARPMPGEAIVYAPAATAAAQLALSEATFGFWAGAEIVAIGGLTPRDDGRRECWFACFPSLARRLPGFVRAAQLTLARLAEDAHTRSSASPSGPAQPGEGKRCIVARVDPGWEPGARLASLVGFERESAGLWVWNGARRK